MKFLSAFICFIVILGLFTTHAAAKKDNMRGSEKVKREADRWADLAHCNTECVNDNKGCFAGCRENLNDCMDDCEKKYRKHRH